MINDIINGICEALFDEFGEERKIYTESVKQGLTEPCFIVLCVNPASDLFFDRRYLRTNLFCVHYFPVSGDESNKENLETLDRLYDCLEYIKVDGDLQRGEGMHGEIVDGVLNFFVNYDLFIKKIPINEPMEELAVTTEVDE